MYTFPGVEVLIDTMNTKIQSYLSYANHSFTFRAPANSIVWQQIYDIKKDCNPHLDRKYKVQTLHGINTRLIISGSFFFFIIIK